jgi:hypothetical protein
MSNSAKLEDVLPLLVSTYQQGRLVPIWGAGMSAPMLTLSDEWMTSGSGSWKRGPRPAYTGSVLPHSALMPGLNKLLR